MGILQRPKIIVAYDLNRGIGYEGELPWSGELKGDMQHFRRATDGNIVLMGRKTLESIGGPLPGRENRILTRDPHFRAAGANIFVNDHVGPLMQDDGDDREIFVIGGSEMYKKYLPASREIVATVIDHQFEADTFFPALLPGRWRVASKIEVKADSKDNMYDYEIDYLRRICGDYIDVNKARSIEQKEQFERIEIDGVCPFCMDNIRQYHPNPIHVHGNNWIVIENMVPYENTDTHLVLVPTAHAEQPSDLSEEAWSELSELISYLSKNIGYGGIAMRFGPMSHTAASVSHLHIHIIRPDDGSDVEKKVRFKISY